MARPTKYKAEYCKMAKKLCELGATVPELAEAFDVAESTVKLWAVKYKGFSDALSIGREPSDNRVERSLYHRACGYSHPHDDIRVVDGNIVITPTTKHYPPDTKAALAWLYNRRRASWSPVPAESDADEVSRIIEVIRATKPA